MAFVQEGEKFPEREEGTRFQEAYTENWHTVISGVHYQPRQGGRPYRFKVGKYTFYLLMEEVSMGVDTGRNEGLHPFLQFPITVNQNVLHCQNI